MTRPTFLSLFSGIGGLDLGLERAGWECVGQVENDPYCNRVLAKHWPDVPRWGDIKEVDPDELPNADLICGGFPCQPVSLAGRRLGQEDERWLWPAMARIVRRLRPRWLLLENVPGLLAGGMGDVLGELAEGGYDAEWDCIPAAAVGAPHLRFRVFVVAYPGSARRREDARGALGDEGQDARWPTADHHLVDGHGEGDRAGPLEDAQGERRGSLWQGDAGQAWADDLTRHASEWRRAHPWPVEPDVGRVADGIPARVDRLRGLGNAVVPQVAELIGRRILEAAA